MLITNSRDLVVISSLRLVRVATLYYHTIAQNDPVNAMLIKCLIDDNLGSDCLTSAIPYPMKLVDFDKISSSYVPQIGTAAAPVYFDYLGQPCTALSSECPFEVSASFSPNCALGASTCASAASILINVKIKMNPIYVSGLMNIAEDTYQVTAAVNDFHGSYFPILPPTTDLGTPISAGAGAGGFISKYVLGTTGTPSPGTTPPSSPPPSSATSTVCAAGQMKTAGCSPFTF